MSDKRTAVFGIYSTRNGAEQAAEALVNAGFASGDISVLLPENLGTREIGTEKNTTIVLPIPIELFRPILEASSTRPTSPGPTSAPALSPTTSKPG